MPSLEVDGWEVVEESFHCPECGNLGRRDVYEGRDDCWRCVSCTTAVFESRVDYWAEVLAFKHMIELAYREALAQAAAAGWPAWKLRRLEFAGFAEPPPEPPAPSARQPWEEVDDEFDLFS